MYAPEWYEKFSVFSKYELQQVEQAIAMRWRDLYAGWLTARGFVASASFNGEHFDYVLVSVPFDREAEWATPEECQVLLDTAANLPIEEAWGRWIWKKAPRPDLEIFEYASSSHLAQMKQEFLESEYGKQFQSDSRFIDRYWSEMRKDTKELKLCRRRMQKEFLELYPQTTSPEEYREAVKALGAKYGFGRNIVRDAIHFALQNSSLILSSDS